MKNIGLVVGMMFWSALIYAQTYSIAGNVVDATTQETLPNANVLLYEASGLKAGISSSTNGNFAFTNLLAGTYTLKISFIGYKVLEKTVQLTENTNLGMLTLEADPQLLDEAEVRSNFARVIVSGDTVAFNADAYKVNADANAQNLLAKMPGVVIQNGTVTAQGEEVKRVLVDGKEFFSSDPNVALQSLPAEIISQIKVFDDQSDQSKFTGFDDGNSIKTINIITKTGKNNGQFGKVYGGLGTDGRYIGGGNMNFFKGTQRWTILGLTNNINVQNFSTQDIVGAIGSSNGSRGRRRGPPGGGGNGASSDASDFLVNSLGGISATNAVGLNYSDEWGKKVKVSGSYFFNESDNTNQQFFNRTYLGVEQANLAYQENDLSTSNNQNHRFNLRMEYTIDDKNSILFRPSFSTQQYVGTSLATASNVFSNGTIQSSNNTDFQTSLTGFTYGSSVLFRHKFEKQSRTLSLNLNTTGTQQKGNNSLVAQNYFALNDSSFFTDQAASLNNYTRTYEAGLVYTEPIGKNMLLFKYEPSIQISDAAQRTNAFDSISDTYSDLQTSLSSEFTSQYQTQAGGVAFMKRGKGESFILELKGQYALLTANQMLPETENVSRSFLNVLPHARYRKTFENKSNLSLFYRSNTIAPTFSQLQTVVDNSNTLQLSTGNPELDQQYAHNFGSRYRATFKEGTHSLFLGVFGEARQDYIANAAFILQNDSAITNTYILPTGAQLIKPVNLNGYYNVNSFASYGFPINKIKSNLNLSANLGYQRAPGLINNVENISTTVSNGIGVVLGSNISEKVDFTLSYNGTYNNVNSSLQANLNNNYYQQTAGVKFNWLFGNGFVFNTDVSQTLYSGLDADINQNFTLWNAGFGYKFLKDDRGELKLSIFDILGENNSISRTITETYVEDQQTTVLQQYIMLSFTYTFRNFGEAPSKTNDEEGDRPSFGGTNGGGRPDDAPPTF